MKAEKQGIVVYGFPAIGKSTLCDDPKYAEKILDLESSNFQWVLSEEDSKLSVEQRKGIARQKNPDWPQNYFAAIKEAIKSYDFVFVAFQAIEFCRQENIDYWRIFPAMDCKDEYIERMRQTRQRARVFGKTSDKLGRVCKRLP